MFHEDSFETQSFEPGSWLFGIVAAVVKAVSGGYDYAAAKLSRIIADDNEVLDMMKLIFRTGVLNGKHR